MINHDGKVLVGDVWSDNGNRHEVLEVYGLLLPVKKVGLRSILFNGEVVYQNCFISVLIKGSELQHRRNEKESCAKCIPYYWLYYDANKSKMKQSLFCPDCGKGLRDA